MAGNFGFTVWLPEDATATFDRVAWDLHPALYVSRNPVLYSMCLLFSVYFIKGKKKRHLQLLPPSVPFFFSLHFHCFFNMLFFPFFNAALSRREGKTNLLPKNGERPEAVLQKQAIATVKKRTNHTEEDEFLDHANIYRNCLTKTQAQAGLEKEAQTKPVKPVQVKDSIQFQDGQCQDCQDKCRVCLLESVNNKSMVLCRDCLRVRLLRMLSIPAEQIHRVAMASLHGEFCAVTTTKTVLSHLRARQF